MDNKLLRRDRDISKMCTEKKKAFFFFCSFVLYNININIYIYKYIKSIGEGGGTITWTTAQRDCTCILTGLSFFVSCLRVFQECFEYCI